MSARSDAHRVLALVRAVERLQKGQPTTLGELATHVFGWDINRVFLATLVPSGMGPESEP